MLNMLLVIHADRDENKRKTIELSYRIITMSKILRILAKTKPAEN